MRKTILAAACLLLSGAPACAQDDGGLFAAFQQARAELAASLSQNTPRMRPPVLLAALSAPDKSWQNILEKLRERGEYRPQDEMIPATFGLADIKGSTEATHQSDYVNVWGFVDEDGVFHAAYVTFVSEHWKLEKDKWRISQWLFKVSIHGEVSSAMTALLIEDLDRRVLHHESQGVKPESPAAKAKYAALVKQWDAFTPKAGEGK